MSRFAEVAFTPSVREVQREQGSDRAVARMLDGAGPEPLGPDEAAFVTGRDGFYLASVGSTGWPYVQYRGGPPGFAHVVDGGASIAFADVRGNRQYVTAGNLRDDDRVALFFMDYARRTRLKVLGHAREIDPADDGPLAAELAEPRTDGRVERIVTIRVEAATWNCPQHITPRYTVEEFAPAVARLRDRIAVVEKENADLRAELARAPHR